MESNFSQHPLRVLALVDSLSEREWILNLLVVKNDEMQVDVVEGDARFTACPSTHSFDCLVIVGDLIDRQKSSFATFLPGRKAQPIVVIGQAGNPSTIVRAMRRGASDYLIREGLVGSDLIGAIKSVVQFSSHSQAKQATFKAQALAERFLKERELQIRGFFEFASVAMALVAPAGTIVRANPALRHLCGYSLEEIIGTAVIDLIGSEDRATVSEGLSRLLSRHLDVCDEELQFRHATGEGIWVSVSFALITNEDGEVEGYTLQATDIRTRKATEAELNRSERRFQELLAQAPIGIFETDKNGSCRFVNERWTGLTGQTQSDALEFDWTRAVHQKDRRHVVSLFKAAVAEGRDFQHEFFFAREDERMVRVAGQAGPTRDSCGEIVGYMGTVTDITDRYQAEQQLRSASTLLRGILDSAPYSVVALSPTGEIREFSRGAEVLLGYSPAEVIGRDIVELFHSREELIARSRVLSDELHRDVAPDLDSLVGHTAPGRAELNNWTYRRKDGSTIFVEVAISEMRDESGSLYGYLAVGNDISERRRKNQELIAAKEAAEQATAAKADFMARMSHEIRTPMNSVLGMSELCLQTALSREQRSFLESVQRSGKILLHLIDDILDFSRGDSKLLSLESVAFDLYETFALSLRGLTHSAGEKGVDLVVRIDPTSPRIVKGDPYRLQQIIINLVANAVKFTEEGEVVIDVSCIKDSETEGLSLFFDVSDTGPGVAVGEQERIFKAFSQEDSGIARRYGGAGLGLAICSQLVDLMDGKIWLESEPGRGSTFHVCLKLGQENLVDAPIDREFLFCPMNTKILVVDSNEKRREVTRQAIESDGYTSVCVAQRADALASAQRMKEEGASFGVVVLDLQHWNEQTEKFLRKLETINGSIGMICQSTTTRVEDQCWSDKLVFLAKPPLPEDLREALGLAILPLSLRSAHVSPKVVKTASHGVSLQILVAEDNATNQQVVCAMLEQLGHQAELVDNGQSALERMRERSFDLVLMDLQMPVMGGKEAVVELRRREAKVGGHVPVVALTAQAMRGDREDCLAAGMDDYLSKPLDIPRLALVIEAYAPAPLERCEETESLLCPASRAPDQSFIDLHALRRRIGDNQAALGKIYSLFERDSAVLLAQLTSQIEGGGAAKKSPEAHTLKGMLSNVCATLPAETAAKLESSTSLGDWSRAQMELVSLRIQILGVLRELHRHSRNSENPGVRSFSGGLLK